MLGFRKIEGIDLTNFKSKFNLNADEMPIVKKLIQENKLTISNNKLRLTNEYIYLANEILVEFIGEDFE